MVVYGMIIGLIFFSEDKGSTIRIIVQVHEHQSYIAYFKVLITCLKYSLYKLTRNTCVSIRFARKLPTYYRVCTGQSIYSNRLKLGQINMVEYFLQILCLTGSHRIFLLKVNSTVYTTFKWNDKF